MPGPFTHIYTARRVADLLGSKSVTDNFIRHDDGNLLPEQKLLPELLAQLGPQQCADLMNHWPKFTAVGAIGPDLFFFLQDYNKKEVPSDEIMLAMSLLYYLDDQNRLDDPFAGLISILAEVVGDTWADILRFIVKLRALWKDFMKKFNEVIGPILEVAGEVIDDLSGQLFSTLGDAFTQLKNGLVALVEEELLSKGDIFGLFALKMRNGFDEQAFLWSDMTHYRRTSMVPARLIFHARDMMKTEATKEHGEQLLAYALGWICHVGTDVIEHAFVNEQCGGPFRTHWQRHHLIENHIDAWNYQCTGNGFLPKDDFVGWQESYPSIADSALYFALQIPQNIDQVPPLTHEEKQGSLRKPLPEGTDIGTQQQRDELLDVDGALPMWLAETIVEVLIEVYAHPEEGGSSALQPEGPIPHPRNLGGKKFQDQLVGDTAKIAKWLAILGVDNIEMALGDLRKIIAPDPPVNVPEGFPLPWEVMTSYRFMLSWFKRQYLSTMDLDKPKPPTVFTPPASDFDFGPPDMSGVSPSDDPISQACEAILAVLDWVFKSLGKAAALLYDIAKMALSAGTWPARKAIYEGVILPLWEATENIRMVLVHLGYAQPQSEQLYPDGKLRRANEIDESLIKLGHSVDSAFQQALSAAFDPLGNLDKDPSLIDDGVRKVLGAKNPWLPVRGVTGEPLPSIRSPAGFDLVEFLRPWAFPDKTNSHDPQKAGNFLEMPTTIAGPYPTDTMPNDLLVATGATSNAARKLYECAGCPNDTDLYTQAFVMHQGTGKFEEEKYRGTNPLGDPIIFSTYLMGQIANNPKFFSNYNLDADRGYGYLCWDWVRVLSDPNGHRDGHDNLYLPPKVLPEGADGWPRPGPAPVGPNPYTGTPLLQLWYPGRTCRENEDSPGGPIK